MNSCSCRPLADGRKRSRLVVAGTRDAITMIEGFAREMPEDSMLQAIQFGHEQIVKIIELIEDLRIKAGLGAESFPAEAAVNPAKEVLQRKPLR